MVQRAHCLTILFALYAGFAPAALADLTVGPPGAGQCGSTCDFNSIQNAVDAATAGETITVYRRTDDATNSFCYDEHVTISTGNLTLQGASSDPELVACIAPSTGGDIITILSDNVTVVNMHISGKANNGNGGTNSFGTGGRSDGHGVMISGADVIGTQVTNCTIDFVFGNHIRFDGDIDQDGVGHVRIRQCYLHHSDHLRNIRIIGGGTSETDSHLIRNNLVHTGQGIMITGSVGYITVDRNVIKGWPYWGHFGTGGLEPFPETGDATHGGGWRYYSNCVAGVRMFDTDPTVLRIHNNLIVGVWTGIRAETSGDIRNNTIVNPFNPNEYDFDGAADPQTIRDGTYGIRLDDGFSGSIHNNIIALTPDNRADGRPGSTTAPYYTPGISGSGIAFGPEGGSLNGATITHNNVWGFVDIDGATALNYGAGVVVDSTNLSVDPQFAADHRDESGGGIAPCVADGLDLDDTRCFEMYEDNYFLTSTQDSGSCHADVVENTAGAVAFVDLSTNGANDPDDHDFSGLAICARSADSGDSSSIDWGTGPVNAEPEKNGDFPNLGAFGGTARASLSPTLRVVSLDAGGARDGAYPYSGTGAVVPHATGITRVDLYFNRAPNVPGGAFTALKPCGQVELAAPQVDTSGANEQPFRVTLSWPDYTFVNRAIRIGISADATPRVSDVEDGDALDGDIGDPLDGPLPSGNGVPGGDAEFLLFSLVGDVDGSRTVTPADIAALVEADGSINNPLLDLDNDGVVEGSSGSDDYNTAITLMADHWVANALPNGAGSLPEILSEVSSGEVVRFDVLSFAPCMLFPNGTITPVAPLPIMAQGRVTIDASEPAVSVTIDGQDAPPSTPGLSISSSGNTIQGLHVVSFDVGIELQDQGATDNLIGGTMDEAAPNGLGQGCRLSGNRVGLLVRRGAKRNDVRGCLIGTDASGLEADGNDVGIEINSAKFNVIGGPAADERNVISGNITGIVVRGSKGTTIRQSHIGVDSTGTNAIPNRGTGVLVKESTQVVIGESGTYTIIGSNGGNAIQIVDSSNTKVLGNFIGQSSNGLSMRNNGDGIQLTRSKLSTIGGVDDEANTIANNGGNGILINDATSLYNAWLGNSLHDNFNSVRILGGGNDDIDPPTLTLLGGSGSFDVEISGVRDGAAVELWSNLTNDRQCTDWELRQVDNAPGDLEDKLGLIRLIITPAHDGTSFVGIQTDIRGNSSEPSDALRYR
jgi:hypothetical protein